MKKNWDKTGILALLPLLVLVSACASSPSFPSVAESQAKIAVLEAQVDSLNRVVSGKSGSTSREYDVVTQFRLGAINRVLSGITNNRNDDVRIQFQQTKPLWKEDKSVLGITYSNYVDVEGGTMAIDLKTFRFDRFDQSGIGATIELEGAGKISVAGKYTGIPASASPDVQFYLGEQIQFDIFPADGDNIMLKPQAKTVYLKTKISIKLLQWDVPWYKEIPLQITDVIKPIIIPASLTSEVLFPVPASRFGDQKYEFVRRKVRLSKAAVSANGDVLEFRSNIEFEK